MARGRHANQEALSLRRLLYLTHRLQARQVVLLPYLSPSSRGCICLIGRRLNQADRFTVHRRSLSTAHSKYGVLVALSSLIEIKAGQIEPQHFLPRQLSLVINSTCPTASPHPEIRSSGSSNTSTHASTPVSPSSHEVREDQRPQPIVLLPIRSCRVLTTLAWRLELPTRSHGHAPSLLLVVTGTNGSSHHRIRRTTFII